MTSVIPDGKTIRKQHFYQTPRSQPTHASRTPTIGLQVLTAAQCISTGDFPNVK